MANSKDIEPMQTPRIVKSHDVRLDGDYAEWIADLKYRYRSAQVKASVRVNSEKLLFNWELGRDLVQKKAEERWGAGVVEQVSLDLQREFPNSDGFSVRNIWYMKQWHLFYNVEDIKLQRPIAEIAEEKLQRPVAEINDEKLQRPVEEIEDAKLHQAGKEIMHQPGAEKLQQPVGEFPVPFGLIPWGQGRIAYARTAQGAHGTAATRDAYYQAIDEKQKIVQKVGDKLSPLLRELKNNNK